MMLMLMKNKKINIKIRKLRDCGGTRHGNSTGCTDSVIASPSIRIRTSYIVCAYTVSSVAPIKCTLFAFVWHIMTNVHDDRHSAGNNARRVFLSAFLRSALCPMPAMPLSSSSASRYRDIVTRYPFHTRIVYLFSLFLLSARWHLLVF